MPFVKAKKYREVEVEVRLVVLIPEDEIQNRSNPKETTPSQFAKNIARGSVCYTADNVVCLGTKAISCNLIEVDELV